MEDAAPEQVIGRIHQLIAYRTGAGSYGRSLYSLPKSLPNAIRLRASEDLARTLEVPVHSVNAGKVRITTVACTGMSRTSWTVSETCLPQPLNDRSSLDGNRLATADVGIYSRMRIQ